MRSPVDPGKIRRLMEELGRRSRGPGKIYLVGGATALLEGWRSSTVEVDLKLDPEPEGVFEAIRSLKNELQINIELASPDQFLPPLPGWKERSPLIAHHGEVEFFHYDLRSQALAKLARGHDRDRLDVRAMIDRGLVKGTELLDAMEEIRTDLIRYPALNAEAFEDRVRRFVENLDD